MHPFRALLFAHRRWTILVVALILCIKALIPVGYMVSNSADVLTVAICDGSGNTVTAQVEIPAKGSLHEGSGQGKLDGHCPYVSLAMAALGGASDALLALALVFLMVLGLAPARRPTSRPIPYLRPPLRGPPSRA